MRIVGRYFGIGASLGSMSGLMVLVLVWAWMTIHLGLIGFLVGWIPASVAAAAAWLVMVLLWGPLVIVAAMAAIVLMLLGGRDGAVWREPAPIEAGPEPAPTTPQLESPREFAEPAETAPEPATEAPPAPSAESSSAPAEPAQSPPPPAPAPVQHAARKPSADALDSLSADADAAGDTSRRQPQ